METFKEKLEKSQKNMDSDEIEAANELFEDEFEEKNFEDFDLIMNLTSDQENLLKKGNYFHNKDGTKTYYLPIKFITTKTKGKYKIEKLKQEDL